MFEFVIFSESAILKPTYNVSTKVNFHLTHNGYNFVKSKVSRISEYQTKTNWRCSFYKDKRYIWKANAYTHNQCGVESVTFRLWIFGHTLSLGKKLRREKMLIMKIYSL